MNPPEYIPLDENPRPENLARQEPLKPVCKCATVPTLILTLMVIIFSGAIVGLSFAVRAETETNPDTEDPRSVLLLTTTQTSIKPRGDQPLEESSEDTELQETQWHRVPGALRERRVIKETHINRTYNHAGVLATLPTRPPPRIIPRFTECKFWTQNNPERWKHLLEGDLPQPGLESECIENHRRNLKAR